MRLIDADILILILTNRHKKHYEDWKAFRKYSGDRRIVSSTKMNECKEIIDIITESKTIDAKSVVHGEWVNEYINRYGHPCHCCSVCGFHASHQDKNFCPECGADMRKKV